MRTGRNQTVYTLTQIPSLSLQCCLVFETRNLVRRLMLFDFTYTTSNTGAKGDWDFRISDQVKNPDGTDIQLPWYKFRLSPEVPVSQIHTPHLYVDGPGIVSDLLRSVQILKRDWGAESNGKLPHPFNPW